jgi:hypothetical protein
MQRALQVVGRSFAPKELEVLQFQGRGTMLKQDVGGR